MRILLPLALVAGILLQAPIVSAGPAGDFEKGWRDFHYLLKKPSKAKYRSYWMQAKNRFWNAYKQNPSGSYAPKSLYYIGRVYEELGKRSWVTQDFLSAVDYYGRCVSRFPRHSWSDDAQYRKALVYRDHLKDTNQAYIELLRVIHNYSKGDMYPKAREALREIDQAHVSSDPAPKPDPEPRPAPSPSGTASLEQIRHWSSDDYTRVVLDLDDSIDYSYDLL
ncbi:MAG: tetratricopeptide repeat protein, partial [Desulfovibrionales bacterium]